MVITDDYTRIRFVIPLSKKGEAAPVLQKWTKDFHGLVKY
jgi:hypothetical protein